jgi:hypothetical protein
MKLSTKLGVALCSVPVIGYIALAYLCNQGAKALFHITESEFNDSPSSLPVDYVNDVPIDVYLASVYNDEPPTIHYLDESALDFLD